MQWWWGYGCRHITSIQQQKRIFCFCFSSFVLFDYVGMRERSVPSSPILMSNLQRFGVCCSCFYVSCAAIRLITRPAPECILRISKPLLEVSFLLFFLFFYSLHHRQMSFKKRPSARGTTTKKWTFSFFILMAVSFWSTARHCGAGKRTRDKPFTPVFFFYIFATVPENKTKHTQMLPPQYSRTVCLCVFFFRFC